MPICGVDARAQSEHLPIIRLQPVADEPGGAAEAAAQVRHPRHRLLRRLQHTQVLRGADCGTYAPTCPLATKPIARLKG